MRIAISGKSGCGNTTVSEIVSRKLNLKLVNYTFQTMASELGMDFYQLCEMAKTDSKFDIRCDNKQKELARGGDCVVGSRLAMWLIDDVDLRVFLHADHDVRVSRIHEREGGNFEDIARKTKSRDSSDHNRYKSLYNIDIDGYHHADLAINTEKSRPETIANIIINAAQTLHEST